MVNSNTSSTGNSAPMSITSDIKVPKAKASSKTTDTSATSVNGGAKKGGMAAGKSAPPPNSSMDTAVSDVVPTIKTGAAVSHHRRADGPTMPLKQSHVSNMKAYLGIQRMKSGTAQPLQEFMRNEVKYIISHIRAVSSRVSDNDVLDALVRCYPGFDREQYRTYLNAETPKLRKCSEVPPGDMSTCIFVSTGPFHAMITEISTELSAVSSSAPSGWSSRARGLLQLVAEKMVLRLMTLSYKIAKTNGRNTMDKRDINMVVEIIRTLGNKI